MKSGGDESFGECCRDAQGDVREAKQLQERPDSSENHTKDEKMLPSVRVTSVDVRQRR